MREDPKPKMEDLTSDITVLDTDSDDDSLVVDDRLYSKKRRLIERILVLSGSEQQRPHPLNVAIIGPPGVGKSSLINTVAASLVDTRWREYAYSGHHGGEQDPITTFTDTFPKCCNEDAFPEQQLPTLIDIAGFPDENTEKWRELLRIVFYGRLPQGEALGQAQEHCEKFGLDGLRQKYSQYDENLKVGRIIFVASATQPVPVNLIKCVLAAARPAGTEKNVAMRTIPIFGVMTKKDKMKDKEEDLNEREKKFVESLGLGGAKHRFLLCSNYCDDVDGGKRTDTVMPELDVPVLRFLCQVCDPVIKVLNPEESYSDVIGSQRPVENVSSMSSHFAQQSTPGNEASAPTPRPEGLRRQPTGLRRRLNEEGFSDNVISLTIIAVEAILVALIFQYAVRPAVDVVQLRGVCNNLRDGRTNAGNLRDNMMDICDDLNTSATWKSLTQSLALVLFLLLRVGITIFQGQLFRAP